MDPADDQKFKRDAALAAFRRMAALSFSGKKRPSPTEDRRRVYQEYQAAQLEYIKSLPAVNIARCPFDGAIVAKAMDIRGIDGLWWDANCWDIPLAGDAHAITYTGALIHAEELAGQVPAGVEILIGPEKPYVIARLLESGAVCVISHVEVLTGAYIMTYFADPPLPGPEGAEPWLRKIFYYTDGSGKQVWNARSDEWDFDIARWCDAGKIYWIERGDAEMTLHKGKARECPYVGLEGGEAPRSMTSRGILQMRPTRAASVIDMFD